MYNRTSATFAFAPRNHAQSCHARKPWEFSPTHRPHNINISAAAARRKTRFVRLGHASLDNHFTTPNPRGRVFPRSLGETVALPLPPPSTLLHRPCRPPAVLEHGRWYQHQDRHAHSAGPCLPTKRPPAHPAPKAARNIATSTGASTGSSPAHTNTHPVGSTRWSRRSGGRGRAWRGSGRSRTSKPRSRWPTGTSTRSGRRLTDGRRTISGSFRQVSTSFRGLSFEVEARERGAQVLSHGELADCGHAPLVRVLRSFSVDENHEKWLKRRRGEQEGAVRLLERLRKRKEEVGSAGAAVRRIEEQRKAYELQRRAAAEAQRRAIEEARRRATEEAHRRAALETRSGLSEDGWWADRATTSWKAAQARSVLGERTNTATGAGSEGGAAGYRVAGRVPPGYWPAAGPSSCLPPPQRPAPQPLLQPPRHSNASQSTGERRPLLQPAGAARGHAPGTAVNSWLVDVESQTRSPAQLRSRVHYLVQNEEMADSGNGCTVSASRPYVL